VEIRNCTVYIDGEPIKEPYKQHDNAYLCRFEEAGYYPPTRVPENNYFADTGDSSHGTTSREGPC